jgi:8-oxo-dGTP diphosphatase
VPDRAIIAMGLIEHGGQVLLVRESYGLKLWGLPGGRVEPGESISSAAMREIGEETGLQAQIEGLLSVRDRRDQACLVFCMSTASRDVSTHDPDEIIDAHWIDAHELASDQYEIDDLSRHILRRWFGRQVKALPLMRWVSRNGREADLFM